MLWFLERGRVPFLILLGVVTAVLGSRCLQLRVDQANRSMDADNPTQVEIENEFNRHFGKGDSILIAVGKNCLLDEEGRSLIEGLVGELQELDGVQQVVSLVTTGFQVRPFEEGWMLSEDGDTAGIRVVLEEFDDDGESLGHLVSDLQGLVVEYSKDGVRMAMTGLPVQKYEVGRLVRKDQRMFGPLSLLVLGGVLLLMTRRLSGMLLPLLVSVLTICWTLGLYSWSGLRLNMITSLLPPVIMTLSVATTIHIYLEWLSRPEKDRIKRIKAAVGCLYKPCLFASLTTAIGFLSLLLSPTPAVRHFGVFAAVGVGISFLLGVVGLSVALSFLRPPSSDRLHGGARWQYLDRFLQRVASLSVMHPWKVVLATMLLSLVGGYGLMKVESDTDLLGFLGDDSALVGDTRWIDSELAGVSTIELMVEAADGEGELSLEELGRFQEALSVLPQVRDAMGITDMVAKGVSLNQIKDLLGGNPFISRELDKTRITVATEMIGSKAGAALIDAIREEGRDVFGDRCVIHPLGGLYRVISDSNELVVMQVKSFAIAIVLILLAVGVVFRSFGYTLLAIVPNVVPLLLVAAVMGFGGIALSTGTAMIASVVIGIAVDDTIHYLSAYRRTVFRDRIEAIRYTTRSTGFVLLSTTMALSAGFWVALFGSFQSTMYFALLTGITMWFAILCDLLVLPAFLRLAPVKTNFELSNTP